MNSTTIQHKFLHWMFAGRDVSSKGILSLQVERLVSILGEEAITTNTKTIMVKIESEDGFDPRRALDFEASVFGVTN